MPVNKNAKLPDKPSDLITSAIIDLEKVEKMPEVYRVNMGNWHEPLFEWNAATSEEVPTGKCALCFAGAVMAMELGCEPVVVCGPNDFDQKTRGKLQALDYFRSGAISQGLIMMNIPRAKVDEAYQTTGAAGDITPYRESPEEFKNDMRLLAETLRRIGL